MAEGPEPRHNPSTAGPVDAGLFLQLSDSLKVALQRIAEADISDDSRLRWQRRLINITNTAKRDLALAQEKYDRFAADLDRELPDQG